MKEITISFLQSQNHSNHHSKNYCWIQNAPLWMGTNYICKCSKELSQFKGEELSREWLIYHIRSTANFKINIQKMRSIIVERFNNSGIPFCPQEILKIKLPKINDFIKEKKHQKVQIQNLIKSYKIQKQLSTNGKESKSHESFIKSPERQLIKIFKGTQVNYQHLQECITKYQQSSRSLNHVIKRLKEIDQILLKEINNYSKLDISIQNKLTFQQLQTFYINVTAIFKHESYFKRVSKFSCFPQRQVYKKQDLLNIVQRASQILQETYQSYPFTNSKQSEFKRLIHIIKGFGQHLNPKLIENLKTYIQQKYQEMKKKVEMLVHSNRFDNSFTEIHDMYKNICNYCELINEEVKIEKIDTIIDQKYSSLKKDIEGIMPQITFTNIHFASVNELQLQKSILELENQYIILQSIWSLNIYAKIKQERFKENIFEKLKKNISLSSKCEDLINSKELKQQSMATLKNILEYLRIFSNFNRLKDECQIILKNIRQLLKRSLQSQTRNLSRITQLMTKSKEISSSITNLDLTLQKIRNYCQFGDIIDSRYKSHVDQVQELFFKEFRSFFSNIKGNISIMKFSMKSKLKYDQITNVVRKIQEFNYLRFIKRNFKFSELEEFQSHPEKVCYQKLFQPYIEIKECIKGRKITKKMLHQLAIFIEYDTHLNKMMSREVYQDHINPVKTQNYAKIIVNLMNQFKGQIVGHLNKIKQNHNLIYKLEKQNLTNLKSTFSLLSDALKDQTIRNQMNRLNIQTSFEQMHKRLLHLLQQNQIILSYQVKSMQAEKVNEQSLAQIRMYWTEMKDFDVGLQKPKRFSEVNKILDDFQLKRLAYIFSQPSINYKQLPWFFSNNRRNPEIVREILNKLKNFDQNFYVKINSTKKYPQDLSFEAENLNYVQLVRKALTFHQEITNILKENGETVNFNLSIPYFGQAIGPFVQQYQRLYQKIMENIYKLKYKSIPYKIEAFFSNLEELTSQLLPNQYRNIKNKIMSIPLNKDFNIDYSIPNKKTITQRICKMNQIIREEIAADCTKVFNILQYSSLKYYELLENQQKKVYLTRLREVFNRQKEGFQEKAKHMNENYEIVLKDFFLSIPIPESQRLIKQQFEAQILQIKKIIKYFKQMNNQNRTKNEISRKTFIEYEFESIFDQSIVSKTKLLQQYQLLCNKYEEQPYVMKQLSDEYSIIKKQAKDKIAERILFLVEENKAKIQQNDYQQIGHLIQNNQNIIDAYKYFIDNDKGASLRIIQKIVDYFETVLILYRLNIKSSQNIKNMYKWEFSQVQKLIRQQFYLRKIAIPIMNLFTYGKQKIKQFKISKKIQIILSDQHKNQYLSLITEQIINYSRQVSNFQFQQLFKILPLPANKQAYREQLQILVQKIALISKIEPVFKQYGLDRFQTRSSTINISNLEPFKSNIVKEIKSAIQQTQLIQYNPQKQLPQKLICLSILCQLIIKNKDKEISNKLESIHNELFKEISYLMGGYIGQIQLIKIQPSKKQGFRLKEIQKKWEKMEKKLSTDAYYIQKAQAVINNLIVAQKMQIKLQLFSWFIQEKSMQIVKLIQKNRSLVTVIINSLRIKESPQINKIINKYQIFKPILNNFNKYQVQNKDAKLLFKQFKIKNQINENSQYTYWDYLNFEQSYNETLTKYLNSPSEITISAISKDIHNSIQNKHKNQVIGKMLGLYAIVKRNEFQQITFQPYPSQFLCITLLLQFSRSLIQAQLKKNIVSMLPGQGKTIALAITACFLVLKGYKVYPICQSQYLAHQNQQHFKQLFQALNIKTSQIKYHALDQFCEQIAGSAKQLIKNYLKGQAPEQQNRGGWLKFLSEKYINWTGSIFCQLNKVILLDQINIIFSEHFEGKVYKPIIQIKDEGYDKHIANTFEYIYNRSKIQYLTPTSIMKTKPYQSLIGKYSRISQIIKSQIAAMLNDVLDEQKINEYYQEAKKKKKLQNKNTFTGYQQSFALLKLKEEGFVSQKQIKNKLKFCIKIGQYSVSQLFRNFDKIIGVGSTLECLSQKDKILLNEHYKIKNIYYIPPIFEKRNIAELTSICQGDLHQKIVKKIKDYFRDKKQTISMIVFFKDHRSLNKFAQQKIIQIAGCQGLNINYLLQQNEEKIKMVASSNCLTLATKQFARGYNYIDNHLTNGLCVVQTYLPSNTYQLEQAKGRIARQGRPGTFSLLIPIQELELIDWGVETYLQNIEAFWREINQQDYYRRQVRRKQAKQKHNIIQYEQGGRIINYVQNINRVQFKPIEKSILLVFGLSQNFINLTDWLLVQLQKYQDLMKRNQIQIKLRYQICYYGNYANYTSKPYVESFRPHENIFRAFKIRSLSELKEKFKKIKPIQTNVKNQQESMEIFLRHVLKLSQKQTVRACFVWGSLNNYSWSTFKRTKQFKLHESSIRKQLGIQQKMKTCQQYIDLIKSKNIIVNIRDPKINQQKKQVFKQFELQFRERMRQAIPYLKSILMQ